MKQHEYGLKVYGFNQIKNVMVTFPTADYLQLEREITSKLRSCESMSNVSDEWFRTNNYQEAISIFLECTRPFEFRPVTIYRNIVDDFIEYIQNAFKRAPYDDELIFNKTKMVEDMFKGDKGRFDDKRKLLRAVERVIENNSDLIEKDGAKIKVNRKILEKDFIYKKEWIDSNYYGKLKSF